MIPGIVVVSLLLFSSAPAQHHPRTLPSTGEKFHQDTATFCIDVDRISDINFRNQEYTIHFWLFITYHDSSFHFEDQLQVLQSKNTRITKLPVVRSDRKKNELDTRLKITCTMAYSWELTGYPFDAQHPVVAIYNAVFDSSRLILKSDGDGIHGGQIYPEHEWELDTTGPLYRNSPSKDGSYARIDPVSSDVEMKHSVLCYTMDLHRTGTNALFLKLFIGMYVAFCVAFTAFFIDVKWVEPRFGLPVGALFAAIANKYVVEAILPQSPEYSIVDWLHTLTFFGIFLIIAFSAISLKLHDDKTKLPPNDLTRLMQWIAKRGWLVVLILYVAGNVACISRAAVQESQWHKRVAGGGHIIPLRRAFQHPAKPLGE